MKHTSRKIMSVVLSIVMILSTMSVCFTSFAAGDPIQIKTVEDLKNVANDLNGNYVLANNIAIDPETTLEPIGNEMTPFNGTFDGAGYLISGLNIASTGNNAGIFGVISESGTVKNLEVSVRKVAGAEKVGAIAGTNLGTISHCSVYGFEVVGSGNFIGGIVGYNQSGTVEYCRSSLDLITAAFQCAAGIAGEATDNAVIRACISMSNLATESASGMQVGGIVGMSMGSTITDCYVKDCTLTAGNYVGAMAGLQSNSTFARIYVENVTLNGLSNNNYGIGLSAGSPNATNTYYLTDEKNVSSSLLKGITAVTKDAFLTANGGAKTWAADYPAVWNADGTIVGLEGCAHKTLAKIDAEAPDCTNTGLTEGYKCADCDKVIIIPTAVPALGHTWDAGVVTTNPTKNADGTWNDGVKTFTCTVCSDTRTEAIARADYDAYDKVIDELEKILDEDDVTDAVKEQIQNILDNQIAQDLTVDNQDDVNTKTDELSKIVEDTNKDIASGKAVKPVYTAFDAAVEAYEKAVADGYVVSAEAAAKVAELKSAVAALKASDSANKADDQATVDDAEADVKAITTNALACAYGHVWDDGEITARPELVDGAWTKGTKTFTCQKDSEHKRYEYLDRADYAAYDEAMAALNAILADDTVNEATKAAVKDFIAKNAIADNLVAEEQAAVNAAATALAGYKATVEENINNGSAVKPVFTAFDAAVEAYEKAVADGYVVSAEAAAKVDELKAAVAALKASDSANKADDQATVDADTAAVNEITANALACVYGHVWDDGEITARPELVDGAWTKGVKTFTCQKDSEHKRYEYLDRADYAAYDEAMAALNAILADDTVNEATKAAAKDFIAKNAIADNLVAEEQAAVDAAAKTLAGYKATVEESIKDGSAVKPDFDNADAAIDAYDKAVEEGRVVSDEAAKRAEEIKNAIDAIKADPEANAKDNQDALDKLVDELNKITENINNCAYGHKFVTYVHDVDSESCTADGTKTAKCEFCDATDTVTDPDTKLGHSFTKYVSNGDATCTEDGTETAKCDRCDVTDTRTDDESALGHTPAVDAAVAPTCTETGLTEGSHCSVCNTVLVAQKTVDALGHTPAAAVVENRVEPTCTKEGSYDSVVYCSVCDAELSREAKTIDKLAHTPAVDAAVAPTCTETGLTEGSHCSVCNTVLVAQQTVDALGHSFTNYVSNSDATCTADGTKTAKCDRCDATDTVADKDSALGHNMGAYVETKAPTCTEKGEERSDCSRCDYFETRELKALGHTAAAAVEENRAEPTCTKEGSYDSVVYCSVCKAELSREAKTIDKLAHTPAVDAAVAPTCTETGLTEGSHCSVCNTVLVAQETVKALGHDMGAYVETKAPTCTEKGEERSDCSRCDHFVTREVAALGHSFTNYVSNDDATCTADGTKTAKCDRCDVTDTVADKGSALGHDFSEWVETKEATCTEPGQIRRDCSRCDHYEVLESTALGHVDFENDHICDRCGAEDVHCHEHVDADNDGICDGCGFDDCLCHRNNIFSKILRLVCTILSIVCMKRIACCYDMEYLFGDIGDMT